MHDGEEAEEEEEEEEEYDVDNELSFTAPLVYDYDYLANIQPKLFKDFNYLPPIILPKKTIATTANSFPSNIKYSSMA